MNPIPARAPDLHSSVTCHVYGSPLDFSDSASSGVGGKALAHRPNILGRKWRTVEGPKRKFKIVFHFTRIVLATRRPWIVFIHFYDRDWNIQSSQFQLFSNFNAKINCYSIAVRVYNIIGSWLDSFVASRQASFQSLARINLQLNLKDTVMSDYQCCSYPKSSGHP